MKGQLKRVIALVAVGLLVALYLLTLVLAIANIPNWERFFFASLAATVVVPILLWINIFLYDRTIGKREVEEGEEELTHGKKTGDS